MKIKLSITVLVLSLILLLEGCSPQNEPYTDASVSTFEETYILKESEDMGQGYIDSFVFFGESTTYHLKSRGVLRGGKNTRQVLHNKSGTAILDTETAKTPVFCPSTGELLPLVEAVGLIKPRYMLLCFGLNGAVQNVNKGEEYFKACYRSLVEEIEYASPKTKIILASCYPVAENMDMTNYSVGYAELNAHIRTLNGWTEELCRDMSLRYLNSNEIMTDKNGNLKLEYQAGDGHHLTAEAYLKILEYIRTHGYK